MFNVAGAQAGAGRAGARRAAAASPSASSATRTAAGAYDAVRMDSRRWTKRSTRGIDRRTFLKTGLLAGGALVGGGLGDSKPSRTPTDATPSRARLRTPSGDADAAPRHARASARPNILVIMVDQLRYPAVVREPRRAARACRRTSQRLREGAVSFARHYTASNDCTPARAALLTGLYTHQTGCMITGGSTLDPGFPTWGSMLREHGYHTRWYGKWHLTHGDNHWTSSSRAERRSSATASPAAPSPRPTARPARAGAWTRASPSSSRSGSRQRRGDAEPWCTTVSFVNPHDIAWWYALERPRRRPRRSAPSVVTAAAAQLRDAGAADRARKPRLQRSLQDTAAASFGAVPVQRPRSAAARGCRSWTST